MTQILRHFIREAISARYLIEAGAEPSRSKSTVGKSLNLMKIDEDPDKRQMLYSNLLLLLLATPAANVGDSTSACANIQMEMSENERRRLCLYIFGCLLAGITIAESAAATIGLWRAGTAALASGSRLTGYAYRIGSITTAINVPLAGKSWYDLHVLCLADPETLGMSEVERDRHIADILGNLYMNFALGGFARGSAEGIKGAQIIQQLKSASTFKNFATSFYDGTVYLRSTPAATIINMYLGYSAGGFYEEIIKRRAESLDLDKIYKVDPEFVEQLSVAIENDRISTIMVDVAHLEDVMRAKIMMLCQAGDDAGAAELYEQYKKLTSD